MTRQHSTAQQTITHDVNRAQHVIVSMGEVSTANLDGESNLKKKEALKDDAPSS